VIFEVVIPLGQSVKKLVRGFLLKAHQIKKATPYGVAFFIWRAVLIWFEPAGSTKRASVLDKERSDAARVADDYAQRA
jgi:hypothetical protein